MCDQAEAMNILGEVYRSVSPILPIQDAYLYGSYARGDYRPSSDVDIMLVSPLSEEEIRRRRRQVSNIVGELCLNHDVLISVAVRSREQFLPKTLPYYRNVVAEGIRFHAPERQGEKS
ncbi:MAG: nucleotidyltransferase domain-containing protein [Clostridia bacterium]|nr:nucleotidyltransferase domain-containing protein [Clostridia bacterium]MBR0406698.1 nucleotidyltransferase domain-containing protein [Clostridia bacterium]